MPSSDEITLLAWFCDKPAAQTFLQIKDANPPAFSNRRISDLKKEGLLIQEYSLEDGELIAKYRISDKGKSLLEQLEQDRKDRAQERADKRADRNTAVFAAIIGAVAGSVLTLLVEHFGEIIDLIQSVFG